MKHEVLALFMGRCLNISNSPRSAVHLTGETVESLSRKFPVSHHAFAQTVLLGPADGFLFEITQAEWTLNRHCSLFSLRLQYSSGADLAKPRQAAEVDWPAVVANLRAYVMSRIPEYLRSQTQAYFEVENNAIDGLLIVPR
ncbi:MAG: hypothetical protein JW873_07025 [Candidatus Saganbacteria bacterium]|nr:hypothetical protein [Candidatus Saganbacteria bacterium]